MNAARQGRERWNNIVVVYADTRLIECILGSVYLPLIYCTCGICDG